MSRLLVFTFAVCVAACADKTGGEGFLVLNNSAPPIGMCAFTGAIGQPTVPFGVISTDTPTSGYLLNPLLESKLTTLTGQDPTVKTITIQGARVDLVFESVTTTSSTGQVTKLTPAVDSSLTHFQTLTSGSLAPNNGTANVSLEVVPWAAIQQLKAGADLTQNFHAVVQATVSFFGDQAGTQADAVPFTYGITVCNQCVVNILSVNGGMCPSMGATPRAGNACNPFQDGVVDCCIESSGALTCPARTM